MVVEEHERLHKTWIHSDQFLPSKFVRPIQNFMRIEAASGIIMLIAAVAAVWWANASFGETYFHFLETHIGLAFGDWHLDLHLGHFINDALMAIFFFVVGMEIKREVVLGELSDRKAAMLPVMAALGGMIVPALIYTAFNAGDPAAMRGWGVPMATDIAFSIGVLSLLGRKVPSGAKLFLLALAIADDLGGIMVIAIFYTEELALGWLGAAIACLALVWAASRAGIRSYAFYIPVALGIWYMFLESGVHATLAGVALGFLTPARPMYSAKELDRKARQVLDTYPTGSDSAEDREHADHEALLLAEISRESVAPLVRNEHRLAMWASFVIIPVFALANAGVRFEGSISDAITSGPALGVMLGLLLGKPIGITLFSFIAVKAGLGKLPNNTTWRHIVGVASIAGIGFTVALFITALAYTDPVLAADAKVGIFAGSILSAIVGSVILGTAKVHPAAAKEDAPFVEDAAPAHT